MKCTWEKLTERLPLIIFLGMYIFSCYLGVLFLLASKNFWAWTNFFAAPRLPSLDHKSFWTLLVLLHGGPILLWLGYEVATVCCSRYLKWKGFVSPDDDQASTGWEFVPYACSLALALWSLARAGAFARLGAWADYGSYVHARWALFSKLTFFEYANLYTWLPCCSAFVLLSRRKWWWLFIPVLGILAIFQLSLFLKKALLTSLVIIAGALWAYWYSGKAPRKEVRARPWLRSLSAFCVVLYSAHAALTVNLVLSRRGEVFALTEQERLMAEQQGRIRKPVEEMEVAQNQPSQIHASKAMAEAKPPSTNMKVKPQIHAPRAMAEAKPPSADIKVKPVEISGPLPEKPRAVVDFDRHLIPSTRGGAILVYAFLAPLTRTSVPTIAYAALFPYQLPYYRLDLGFDILGLGRMPDDNLSVCDYLWPNQMGSVAVPFHFVLYSQGGIPVAFVGSFLVGAFIAICWYLISACRRPSMAGSVLASVILTYAWLISIDSLRNNTVESYGMIWAVVLLSLLHWWGDRARRRGEVDGSAN